MELHAEAIRQQFLKKRSHLPIVRLALHIGFPENVVPILFDSIRRTDELARMNPVGDQNEITHRQIGGGELTSLHPDSSTAFAGIGWFDAGHFNAGSASGGIIRGGGGGSGIFHAVSAVARVRFRVSGMPPPELVVHFPVMEFPSPLRFPV